MRAKDIMIDDVICINVKESVFDAAELLLGAGVSAAPVVDDKGAVVGIVSEADLIRRAEIDTTAKKSWLARLLDSEASAAHDFVAANTRRVSDVMTKEVVTATEDATLGELVGLMERHGIKRIPIVRVPESLVGSSEPRRTCSRAAVARAGRARCCSRPTRSCARPSSRRWRTVPWTSKWPTNVFANDGVVHLWGFVDGEEVRKAYRVAAENVPGVRRVKNHLRALPPSVGMGV